MPLVPIEEEIEQGRITVPVEDDVAPAEARERAKTAALIAKDNGEDPVQAFGEAVESQSRDDMDRKFTERVEATRTRQITEEAPWVSPEQTLADAEGMVTNLEGEFDHGNYKEAIKSMPMSRTATEEQISKEAVVTEIRETTGEIAEGFASQGILGKVGTVAGVLAPTRRNLAVAELMRLTGFEETFIESAGTFFDPTTPLVKLRNTFQRVDEKGKIEMLNLLAEHLPNSTDNELLQADILDAIIGDYRDEDLDRVFASLEVAEVGALAGATVKLINGLRRSGSILNTPRRLKDADVEAELIEDAARNPEAAAAVGIDQAQIGDHLNPLVKNEIGTLLIGASEDQAAAVTKMMNIQEAHFNLIAKEIDRTGILSHNEIRDQLRAAEIRKLEEPGVIEANVKLLDDNSGFQMEWTEAYYDRAGRFRRKGHKETVDFKVSDIGELKANEDEWVDKILAMDPNARLRHRLRQWFVTDVETMSRKQEMTAAAFGKMMKQAFKGIGPRAAARVNRVLRQGAKDGRTYNWEELISGEAGVALKPKEAKAYLGYRNVVDNLYLLKNKQVTDQWVAQGVKLWDGPEGPLPIRRYDSGRAAYTAWRQTKSDSNHILIPERGLTLGGYSWDGGLVSLTRKGELTKEMVEEAYSKGYVLARNHNSQGFFKLGDNKTQWAFVKAKNVHSPRGRMVLNRIEGYIPKQRTGAYWFVKKKVPSGLSGARGTHSIMKTEAYSDTREAALEWINKQENPSEWKLLADREMPADERAADVLNTHGGMYAGHRKSTELEYVGASDPHFADAFEAIQHYINHIGRQYPAALYRLGSEHRLMQIAKGLGVKGKDIGLHNVLARATEAGIAKTSKEYKMLKDIHDQVSFVHMIPTDEERAMSHLIRKMGMFTDNRFLNKVPGWSKVPKFFYRKAAENAQPVNVIRGLTFNHLLGMYNPAQIFVQFSGSLISMAIDPIGYPKHVAKMVGWGTLDNIYTDPIAQKKLINWMKSNGLEDYADEYELWRKSGYLESVTQGNADYVSVFTRNMPFDDTITRKVMANHTMFYKMGELANTRVAFATSVSRYKKVHNVKKIDPNDVAAMDEISLWAEKYRLNMSRANQSDLNKGWKGAPLQFQQVISKYFEKVLPQWAGGTDEFTSWEKARLAAIPTAITGSVGIPFGQDIARWVLDTFGIDETELTEEEAIGIKYGAVGLATNVLLDMNVNVSDRMTMGGDVIRNLYEALTTGKATWQWLGASATVADRYARNMQLLSEAFNILPPAPGEEEVDTVDDIIMWASLIKEIASDIPTVSRNWKQYSMHIFGDNPRYVKDGRYMWEFETMNTQTAVGAVFGFQPTEIVEMYELSKELKGNQSSIAQFGDTDAQIITRIINMKLLGGGKIHETKKYARLINNMLHKYGPIRQRELLDKIWNLMHTKQLDPNNLMWKSMMEELKRRQKGLDIINTQVNRKLQERQ